MKRKLIALVGLVAASLLLNGCGESAPKMSAKEKALFEAAPPEIRQVFETALVADQANDYLSAYTNYQALLSKNPSVDQIMAVQTAVKSLHQRIYDAAAKGDAGAQAAVDYLKAHNGRPGR